MNTKELFSKMLKTFFIIFTLITLVVGILGMIFQHEVKFGYEIFFIPHIYAFASLIPSVIMYSRNELSVKSMIIRKIIQFVAIEIVILALIFWKNIFKVEYRGTVIGVALSILVIFVLVHLIEALIECLDARKMNEDLEKYLMKNKAED